MSNPAQLPARPSLVQLRKQAKERLETLRAADADASLADAQFAVARDYGFASWPKLVHHVESVLSSARLEQFEQLANDILAGYGGDREALVRLIAHYGVGHGPEQFRERVRSRVNDARGSTEAVPTLADVRQLVAHD